MADRGFLGRRCGSEELSFEYILGFSRNERIHRKSESSNCRWSGDATADSVLIGRRCGSDELCFEYRVGYSSKLKNKIEGAYSKAAYYKINKQTAP